MLSKAHSLQQGPLLYLLSVGFDKCLIRISIFTITDISLIALWLYLLNFSYSITLSILLEKGLPFQEVWQLGLHSMDVACTDHHFSFSTYI